MTPDKPDAQDLLFKRRDFRILVQKVDLDAAGERDHRCVVRLDPPQACSSILQLYRLPSHMPRLSGGRR